MSTYRWRVACDAAKPQGAVYERYWTRKDQAARVDAAQRCWHGGLIAERCTFGHRRLILEGQIEQPNVYMAQSLAVEVAKWTLSALYGLREFGDSRAPELGHPDIRVREVEARMADTLADTGHRME